MERRFFQPNMPFPPGFRFHPTDQELIIHYLMKKVASSLPPSSSIITDIDIYKFNPWELPEKAFFGEGEWFFFSPRDRKYPNGVRPNRAAACGYWKATGTDKPILATGASHCLGVKKALVFYKGRPPKGIKTDWVMNEYRLLNSTSSVSNKQSGTMRLDDWVLCRVRKKGSVVAENDEKPTLAAFVFSKVQKHESQVSLKERSGLLDFSDCQLMSYLLGSEASEAESAGDSSDFFHGCKYIGAQQRAEMIPTMLSSIKRKFSVDDLDELMMLHPGKKSNFHFSEGEQLSPTGSGTDEQGCLGFLI